MKVLAGEEACSAYAKKGARIYEPYIPNDEDFKFAKDEGDIDVELPS